MFRFENFFFTIPFLGNGAMYGPGSSKKNGVGGPNRKLPFLNVHTQLKRGRCRHSPVASLKYHCLPMVHFNTAPHFLLHSVSQEGERKKHCFFILQSHHQYFYFVSTLPCKEGKIAQRPSHTRDRSKTKAKQTTKKWKINPKPRTGP